MAKFDTRPRNNCDMATFRGSFVAVRDAADARSAVAKVDNRDNRERGPDITTPGVAVVLLYTALQVTHIPFIFVHTVVIVPPTNGSYTMSDAK